MGMLTFSVLWTFIHLSLVSSQNAPQRDPMPSMYRNQRGAQDKFSTMVSPSAKQNPTDPHYNQGGYIVSREVVPDRSLGLSQPWVAPSNLEKPIMSELVQPSPANTPTGQRASKTVRIPPNTYDQPSSAGPPQGPEYKTNPADSTQSLQATFTELHKLLVPDQGAQFDPSSIHLFQDIINSATPEVIDVLIKSPNQESAPTYQTSSQNQIQTEPAAQNQAIGNEGKISPALSPILVPSSQLSPVVGNPSGQKEQSYTTVVDKQPKPIRLDPELLTVPKSDIVNVNQGANLGSPLLDASATVDASVALDTGMTVQDVHDLLEIFTGKSPSTEMNQRSIVETKQRPEPLASQTGQYNPGSGQPDSGMIAQYESTSQYGTSGINVPQQTDPVRGYTQDPAVQRDVNIVQLEQQTGTQSQPPQSEYFQLPPQQVGTQSQPSQSEYVQNPQTVNQVPTSGGQNIFENPLLPEFIGDPSMQGNPYGLEQQPRYQGNTGLIEQPVIEKTSTLGNQQQNYGSPTTGQVEPLSSGIQDVLPMQPRNTEYANQPGNAQEIQPANAYVQTPTAPEPATGTPTYEATGGILEPLPGSQQTSVPVEHISSTSNGFQSALANFDQVMKDNPVLVLHNIDILKRWLKNLERSLDALSQKHGKPPVDTAAQIVDKPAPVYESPHAEKMTGTVEQLTKSMETGGFVDSTYAGIYSGGNSPNLVHTASVPIDIPQKQHKSNPPIHVPAETFEGNAFSESQRLKTQANNVVGPKQETGKERIGMEPPIPIKQPTQGTGTVTTPLEPMEQRSYEAALPSTNPGTKAGAVVDTSSGGVVDVGKTGASTVSTVASPGNYAQNPSNTLDAQGPFNAATKVGEWVSRPRTTEPGQGTPTSEPIVTGSAAQSSSSQNNPAPNNAAIGRAGTNIYGQSSTANNVRTPNNVASIQNVATGVATEPQNPVQEPPQYVASQTTSGTSSQMSGSSVSAPATPNTQPVVAPEYIPPPTTPRPLTRSERLAKRREERRLAREQRRQARRERRQQQRDIRIFRDRLQRMSQAEKVELMTKYKAMSLSQRKRLVDEILKQQRATTYV